MKKDKTFRPDRVLSYFKAEWLPLAFVTLSGLVYNIGLLATPWFEGRLAQCLADILGGSETAAKMAMLVLAYIVVTLAVQAARFMHLLLKEEQTAAYSVEIWKRFRKWGGIPTGLTQNVKDLLSSREVENIFENSDMIIMLNQAAGDRQILAKQLNISPHQLSYVTHSGEGEGLLFFGNVILPFVDRFPTDLELYRIMTTKLGEVSEGKKE